MLIRLEGLICSDLGRRVSKPELHPTAQRSLRSSGDEADVQNTRKRERGCLPLDPELERNAT